MVFLNTDKQILEASQNESWKSGSTVVISLMVKDILYVANCGDSEAVLGKKKEDGTYEPVLLSKKHKPGDQDEKDRIKKAGGHVVFNRVMGSLAVARALGDRDFKHPYNKSNGDFVSPEPHINKIILQPEDEFLIVSCDGLWDKLSYETAVEFVSQCKAQGKDPTEAAQLLVQDSLERGTLDNVTAIIVYFPQTNTNTDIKHKSNKKKNLEKKKEKQIDEKKIENKDTDDHQATESKLMDVYEFLAQEKDRIKKSENGDQLIFSPSPEISPRVVDKLKLFDLPEGEELIADFACLLETKILYQGVLLITPNHLCFYSSFPSKKTKTKIHVKEIQCIEKTKSLLVASAIKITTKDGKKAYL